MDTTDEPTDHQIAEMMLTYGGSFTSGLGNLWIRADASNRRKLQDAFPDAWKAFRELYRQRATLQTKGAR